MDKFKPTILYVEDESGTRDELSFSLKRFASELFIACDGQEGLKLYKKHLPDIVVTDIKMPNMTGIEMVEEIKKINSKQPVIFTTAFSESGFFIEAIELSIDAYILKPVNLKKLQNKIDSICQNLQMRKEYQKQQFLIDEIDSFSEIFMMIFDSSKKIIYINQFTLDFFNVQNTAEFIAKNNSLSKCFINGEQYYYPKDTSNDLWLDEISKIEEKQIVTMLNIKEQEPKAYVIDTKYNEKSKHTILYATEITNIVSQSEELRKKAFFDELTQIFNRTYFNQEIIKEIANSKRHKEPFCLVIFDIDFFKKINDTHGHQIGDEILIELSNMIANKTRETDIFARWGGEEFVIILSKTDIGKGLSIVEKLRESINKNRFINDLKITVSFGITQNIENDTPETILKRADDLLYKAKNNGRNRVESIMEVE